MTRGSRVIVEPLDPLDTDMVWSYFDRNYLGRVSGSLGDRFDAERDGSEIQFYVDAPTDPAVVEAAVMEALAELELLDMVLLPLPVEHWDDDKDRYVDPEDDDLADFDELTDVRWSVVIEPTTLFDWNAVREELEIRKRPPLKETDSVLVVPASTEADGQEIAAAIRQLSSVGTISVEKLGWFGRWRARQLLFGGYWSGGGGG